jgi:hypothetical protein
MTPDDIPMEKVIYLDIQQHTRPEPILGQIRNVVISGITATTQGRCVLTAQEGAWIEDVTLRDISLTYPSIENATELARTNRSRQNSNFNPEARAAQAVLVAENVKRLNVQNLRATLPSPPLAPPTRAIWMRNVKDAVMDTHHLFGNGPEDHRSET